MMKTTLYSTPLLLLLLCQIQFLRVSGAFVPNSNGILTPSAPSSSSSSTTLSRQSMLLQAVALPAEQEDEKRKKRDPNETNTNHNDWTTTKGGFLPNILKRKQRSSNPKIHMVDNIQDYKTIVADEKEQLVVVRFFAHWCQSCRATKPHFHKLVQSYSEESVKFVQVPLTKETAYLQQGLDVPSVPFAHIYHPEAGLVEEMKVSKPHFSEFRKKLNSYVVGSCDVPEEEEEDGVVVVEPMGSFE